jgi:hypothetical protein
MLTSRKCLWWRLPLIGCYLSLLAVPQIALAQTRQPAAELITLMGKAEIKSPGETQFRPAKLRDKLYPQDQIRTLADSRAKLFFQDESILILSENTTLDIAKFQMTPRGERQSALMKLLQGSLRFIVHKVYAGVPPNFEVQGKTAVMGIRGTDAVVESRSPDVIYFLSGRSTLVIRNMTTDQTLILTPNNFITANPGQPMCIGVITPQMRQRLLQHFQLSQSFVPETVSSPGPPPPGLVALLRGMRLSFGNPLLPQTDQFRSSYNPSAQGTGTLQTPLSASHPLLFPK